MAGRQGRVQRQRSSSCPGLDLQERCSARASSPRGRENLMPTIGQRAGTQQVDRTLPSASSHNIPFLCGFDDPSTPSGTLNCGVALGPRSGPTLPFSQMSQPLCGFGGDDEAPHTPGCSFPQCGSFGQNRGTRNVSDEEAPAARVSNPSGSLPTVGENAHHPQSCCGNVGQRIRCLTQGICVCGALGLLLQVIVFHFLLSSVVRQFLHDMLEKFLRLEYLGYFKLWHTCLSCAVCGIFMCPDVRSYLKDCVKAFRDPNTRILNRSDQARLLADLCILRKDPENFEDLKTELKANFADCSWETMWETIGTCLKGGLFATAWGMSSALGSEATVGRSAAASIVYARMSDFTTDEDKVEARSRLKRVICALENTVHATARDYGASPANVKDILHHIFQEPMYHNIFAFYYKHPIFASENRRCLLGSLIFSQIALYTFLAFVAPFTVTAVEFMHISVQARLIRHAVHRHVLMPLIISVFVTYISYSCLSGEGFLDTDWKDEGQVLAVCTVLAVCFGAFGGLS